jgi:hypothetical protein
LKHACIFWDRGFQSIPTPDLVGRDSVTKRYGVGSGASYTYPSIDAGRTVTSPVGGTTITSWADVNNEFDSSRGLTAFFVARPLSLDQPAVAVPYAKRDTASATAAGWEFQTRSAPSPDTWFATIADGATSVDCLGTTSLSLTRTDVVAMRADPERGFLSLWLNGKKEIETAMGAVVPGNNALAVKVFDTFEGNIACVALWNRPFADSELRELFRDPFLLWRPARRDFMQGIGFGPTARNSFFLTF